jgi:HSP20 family protein
MHGQVPFSTLARNFLAGESDMSFELWDPLREAVSLRDAVNTLLQESFVRPGSSPASSASPSFTLPLDVAENENEFVVKASLPGVKPESVQITIQGDALSIRAEAHANAEQKGERWHLRERRSGAFQRSLSLGTPVDSDKAHADFEHGVLTLTLPKAESSKPRQIKIGSRGVAGNGLQNGDRQDASRQ